MNTIEYQAEKNIMVPSPFHLDENWCIQIANHNRNCTHNEIDTLTMKKILNYMDFEILKLLAVYRYINTHNLEFALRHILPECYIKTDYKQNLHKLTHAGLLLKHRLYQHSENAVYCTPVSPLCFYSLSPGAYSYIAPLVESPYSISSALPDYMVMEQLATTQLLIQAQVSYKDSIRICYRNVRKKIGTHTFALDAVIRFFTYAAEPPHSITLFLLCGRSQGESQKSLLSRICLFFRWLEKHHDEYGQFMILILVECFKDIPIISHNIAVSQRDCFTFPLYYAVDTDLLTAPLFDRLYQCFETESSNKSTVEQIKVHL